MPVYEYYCDECGCRFEEYREVSDRSTCPCPECSEPARKVFRPVGIIFKGSGFYVTDNREPEEKSKREAEAAKPKPAGAASDKGGGSD